MKQILKTCTQCGAPLEGLKCEYCDTIYYNVEDELARLEAEIKHVQWQIECEERYYQMIAELEVATCGSSLADKAEFEYKI